MNCSSPLFFRKRKEGKSKKKKKEGRREEKGTNADVPKSHGLLKDDSDDGGEGLIKEILKLHIYVECKNFDMCSEVLLLRFNVIHLCFVWGHMGL